MDDERFLFVIKTIGTKVFQYSHNFVSTAFSMDHTTYYLISPTHPFCKVLIHHHFILFAGHTSLFHLHSHHSGIVFFFLTKAGREKCLSTLILYHHTTKTNARRVWSRWNTLHIGQSFEELTGIITIFWCTAKGGIAINNLFWIIARVFVQYIFVLNHHHTHQSAYKSYSGKLNEQ